ncbi:MAG: plasmid partitioning protein RepA [Proteobacteria bacterium]|nr:plasmid partitioning protein RepA [Pseudomonadota bacterium]
MTMDSLAPSAVDDVIAGDAAILSRQLQVLRERLFPPSAEKELRRFSSGEAARLIGVSDSYLRQLSLAGEGPQPEVGPGGRRLYGLDQINALRRHLSREGGRGRDYDPTRRPGEKLQVIAVTNFKGGSGKTTTTAHFAQYLALQGFRVLAVDLDPQASLSALFGVQPEFDVGPNRTLYGAIRYDDERRPLADILRKTYFDGIDLVPGNLELQEFEHTTPKVLAEDRRQAAFFNRVWEALQSVEANYDVVVIDCPPQLGFLTLSALCAATGLVVTVHPQMLDVASMSQFLFMAADLLSVVRAAGGDLSFDFLRYVITRHEPADGPQAQIVGFLRSLFGERVATATVLKSTAIADAGLTKQTLYEIGAQNFSRSTYERVMESVDAVNGELTGLIRKSWGRA